MEEWVMTTKEENEHAASESTFLTSEEQAVCQQIAAREAPHSQRASALLALNEGTTQAQAAEQGGLTPGQMKYWLTKFRKQRLGIFPAVLLDEPDKQAEAKVIPEMVVEPEPVTEKGEPIKNKKKTTKGVKGKMAKKKKKKGKKKKGKKKKKKKK